jgi:hypothetical protein
MSRKMDDKNLMTLPEAAIYLFNDDSHAAYKRARRLIENAGVPTIRSGKAIYVSRATLDDQFNIRLVNDNA